jgi:hypothetical protein
MERGSWKRPVVLEIFGRPGVTTVNDTLDAALVLLGAWPHKRTPAHMAAVTTCRDVLAARAEPGLARVDFIEAALEAGFHVQTETFLQDVATPTLSAAEPIDDGAYRRLPSILSFARPLVRGTSSASQAREQSEPLAVTTPQAEPQALSAAPSPTRWPPPAWASIALDHEIAEQAGTAAMPTYMQQTLPAETIPDELLTASTGATARRSSPLPVFAFDVESLAITAVERTADHASETVLRDDTQTGRPSHAHADPSPAQHLPRVTKDTGTKRRTIEWSALPASTAAQSDSPGFGELLLRLFDTLGMIGLVTLKSVAGMLNLHLNILHRNQPQGRAQSN